MKVLGGRNLPGHWERFDRLQRTVQKLLEGPRHPIGVFRFKTHEELDEWERKLQTRPRASRPKTT